MSYTEQDLRAVLGALETDAPEVADTLAGVDRLRRRRTVRRRTVGMATVVAAIVALAAGSLAVPGVFTGQSTQPATAAGDPLQYRFAVDAIPGASVDFLHLEHDREVAEVRRPGALPVMIDVYARGVYDPSLARTGEPVDVNGKRALYHPKLPHPGVVWEYEPDSWVMVHLPWSAEIDREELLRVARVVRFDRTTPLLVPFRVGYLPADLRPSTGGGTLRPEGAIVTVQLSAAGDKNARVNIAATGSANPPRPPKDSRGEPGSFPGLVRVDLGTFMVTVHAITPGTVSDEELNKIAQSITAASQSVDPATWIPTDQAFPTR